MLYSRTDLGELGVERGAVRVPAHRPDGEGERLVAGLPLYGAAAQQRGQTSPPLAALCSVQQCRRTHTLQGSSFFQGVRFSVQTFSPGSEATRR